MGQATKEHEDWRSSHIERSDNIWPLARVVQIYPDNDGYVRVAIVRESIGGQLQKRFYSFQKKRKRDHHRGGVCLGKTSYSPDAKDFVNCC